MSNLLPSKDRWAALQTILDKALDLPESRRLAYVKLACKKDASLYDDIARILQAENNAPKLLESDAFNSLRPYITTDGTQNREDTNNSGKQIGAFRLCEQIGSGGMGVVYRAERITGGFEQQVAIKLSEKWKGRQSHLDRFLQEQKVLAKLNHPNIAKLFDGGFTQDGQPWFAMELVEGMPIDTYCDQLKLTVRKRLELVVQIAKALQYAHNNLIVHRDIKPSNILVTSNGLIKLLDFGIAKLLVNESSFDLTLTGQPLLTPGFAAPEQLKGQAITIATDIFQLGVVCYQMLCGFPAFNGTSQSIYDLIHLMFDKSSCSPSDYFVPQKTTVLRKKIAREKQRSFAQHRGLSEKKLYHELRGDIDAITMKAIQLEPELRYSSMSEFVDDIQAYFSSRPVIATKFTRSYQVCKFAIRHKWILMAVSLAAAMVVSYTITVTLQSRIITKALQQAHLETQKAEQVSAFLIDLFEQADPNVAASGSITAIDLLERGKNKIDSNLIDSPEVKAHMFYAFGLIERNLGRYTQSISLFERAMNIYHELSLTGKIEYADILSDLAVAYTEIDNYAQAESLFKKSYLIYRELGIINTKKYAETMSGLAQANLGLNAMSKAEVYLTESISILNGFDDSIELANSLNSLAMIENSKGYAESAEQNMREAITIYGKVLGEHHSYYSMALLNLGHVLLGKEKLEEAEGYFEEALKIQQDILDPMHPYIANTLSRLGRMKSQKLEFAAAKAYLNEALTIEREIYQSNNSRTAITLGRLAKLMMETNELSIAESYLLEALAINQELFPEESFQIALNYLNLGSLKLYQLDYVEAKRLYELSMHTLPQTSFSKTRAQLELAIVHFKSNNLSDAEYLASEVLDRRKSKNEWQVHVAEAEIVVAVIELKQNNGGSRRMLNAAYQSLKPRRSESNLYINLARETIEN